SVSVIRALSLGELEFKDIFKVIWKEFRVSFLCGLTLTAANYVRLMLLEKVTAMQALTICLTMLCTVIIAKFVGCTLPMLAKKIGLDPAVMASPFITTIVDVLSLLIYFQFATFILKV
ncbi:MAG: magnesium transporter, partial [Lachnospiraceae bacterium]|nr:magnesium transporter [Lachnospiraceae bacterium]